MEEEFPAACAQIKSFVEALGYRYVGSTRSVTQGGGEVVHFTAIAPTVVKEIKITARIEA